MSVRAIRVLKSLKISKHEFLAIAFQKYNRTPSLQEEFSKK
jgi:hypothetical protein